MTIQIDSLRRAATAVFARDGVDVTGLPVPDLMAFSGEVARLRRDADLLMAEVAAEIRRRSEGPDVGSGLAVGQGFRSTGELLAQATGGTMAEAKRLMRVGDLLATATGIEDTPVSGEADGEQTPMTRFRAELAEAVREGLIGIDGAAVFTAA